MSILTFLLSFKKVIRGIEGKAKGTQSFVTKERLVWLGPVLGTISRSARCAPLPNPQNGQGITPGQRRYADRHGKIGNANNPNTAKLRTITGSFLLKAMRANSMTPTDGTINKKNKKPSGKTISGFITIPPFREVAVYLNMRQTPFFPKETVKHSTFSVLCQWISVIAEFKHRSPFLG